VRCAGGEHRFQRILRERGLARWPLAACGIGAANAPHQLLHGGVARGIEDIAHLVGFGEHREPVQHGVERGRAELTLEGAVDERVVDRQRQVVNQMALRSRALHVIHEKLQDRRDRDGQGDGGSIT
jgi:hypothetical protein